MCERTRCAASSGYTYLEEASSGVGAIVSKSVAEPAVLFDPHGSFGHQRKKNKLSLRPESMASTQRTRGEVVNAAGQR